MQQAFPQTPKYSNVWKSISSPLCQLLDVKINTEWISKRKWKLCFDETRWEITLAKDCQFPGWYQFGYWWLRILVTTTTDSFGKGQLISEWRFGVVQFSKRDHPFKTSALLRGGGVKNLPFLPTDSSKKLPTVGG